jgi:hypothetical protein
MNIDRKTTNRKKGRFILKIAVAIGDGYMSAHIFSARNSITFELIFQVSYGSLIGLSDLFRS